jgi:antitoxin component YwqK of YwqJK toxin-antitoxin module
MNYSKVLLAIIITGSLSVACSRNHSKDQASGADTLQPGEKPVIEDEKLRYIVTYKDGKANGRVREYTRDGKLYMDAIYKDDHRHGKCIHYYKSGKPFSVSYYVNGEKDSIETKYAETGWKMAEIPYSKDKVQPGLKEFDKTGNQINKDVKLAFSTVDHSSLEQKFFIKVKLVPEQTNVKYYASPASDPLSREKLQIVGGTGMLEVPVYKRESVREKILFEAEYKTRMGNINRVQQVYNLAVN